MKWQQLARTWSGAATVHKLVHRFLGAAHMRGIPGVVRAV